MFWAAVRGPDPCLNLMLGRTCSKYKGLGTSLVVHLDAVLPLQGPWVQSLVGELRSHKPCGIAKEK